MVKSHVPSTVITILREDHLSFAPMLIFFSVAGCGLVDIVGEVEADALSQGKAPALRE